MKIVISTAIYYPQINGVATFSHNLACGLAKRGHEVMVLCPSQTGKSYTRTVDGVKIAYLKSVETKVYPDQIHEIPESRKVLGIRMPRLWYKHGFRVSVFPATETKKALDSFQPDVVHVQVSDPIGLSVVGWARKAGVPVVTTEHNQPEVFTGPLPIPKIMQKGANAVLAAYFRNRQSKSDFVTMPTKKAILNLLGDGNEFPVPVAAVSNGVDLTHFNPGKAPDTIYKRYKLQQNTPTVLYVGRVDPEKKVELVLESAKKAHAKIPNLQMVVVGDGVDKARLKKKYGSESWVHFLGRVIGTDLYDLYKVGWIFVTASPIETQGIVLIEAAASGLPLVAVDTGAVSEVCQNDVNGFLCRVGDVAKMAEAITRILNDNQLRTRFAKKSIQIASEHDFEYTLDKFINIYNRVLQNN